MASLQKIALYIFFDSVESDLIQSIRKYLSPDQEEILTPQERAKAGDNLARRNDMISFASDIDLIMGLDLGEKYDVLLRLKNNMDETTRKHYSSVKKHFDKCIQVRNSVMHGRPLTIDEYATAFALTNELLRKKAFWPKLSEAYKRYTDDPASLVETAINYLEEFSQVETFNNLPLPDYEDTGFFSRKKLEAELKRKILGRHPVVTVLGDGGDGKTAVTLQTLYGLLASNDHNFDAIIWVSAKSSKLTGKEIERIETAITSSIAIFDEVVNLFETASDEPMKRVFSLMESNKILLVIDNLETVIDKTIRNFAEDIPGESKLLLTSRIPLGSDLSVQVDPFSESEALSFLRVLISTYNVKSLKRETDEQLRHYALRLHHKPLLLKWFALGVLSGLSPSSIVGNPQNALKFCLENVFDALSATAKDHLSALATLPRSASIAELEYVARADVVAIEASLAELMRHSIVEQDAESKCETSFQIKPLAKAYLVRVLKARSKDEESILKRFRQIEGIYQNERGAQQHDRYNPNHYTVRSKSEAIAVSKLRNSIRLAKSEEFLLAFEIIDSLKVSNSDYFEVSRTEAYIAALSGDNARAQDAYIAALEADARQPQVHMLYGGFLLRTFADHEAALEQFKSAIRLDNTSVPAYIGAARASLYLFDFAGADDFLDNAHTFSDLDTKTTAILSDLQLQSLWRNFEHLSKQFDDAATKSSLERLIGHLKGVGISSIDATFVAHLRKYLAILPSLKDGAHRDLHYDVDILNEHIGGILKLAGVKLDAVSGTVEGNSTTSVGELKKSGRKPNFGFLQDFNGVETFVHRSATEPAVWNAMLDGEKVRYVIVTDAEGKTKAESIALA